MDRPLPTLRAGLVLNNQTVPVVLALPPNSIAALRSLLDQPPPVDAEPWIDATEAARHISAKLHRLYFLTSRNAIPFRKEGGRLLFKRSMLDAWVVEGCPSRPPGRIAN